MTTTATRRRTSPEEDIMARNIDTTLVACPMHRDNDGPLSCGGEMVEAVGFGSFRAATVRVAPCSSLTRQGWGTGPQLVKRKSQADYLLPAPAPMLQHRAGLVVFA